MMSRLEKKDGEEDNNRHLLENFLSNFFTLANSNYLEP